jgi:matrix metalloproteinase-14 (membrane-inserted)
MKKNTLIVIAGLFFLMAWTTASAERYVPDQHPTGIVNWGNGKAYFFSGGQYIRYDIASDKADPGYPKNINAETWPGVIWMDGIDAVVNWGNGKAYFFKGGQYIRYDIKADRADPGYPKNINAETWPGVIWTDGIDAVVNWGNGKAYFFKGGQYIRYDIKADRADPGYPKNINAETWPGVIWTDGIDDAVNWGNGKAYFFKGGQYIRYDIKADRADPGYPKNINAETWPGLIR